MPDDVAMSSRPTGPVARPAQKDDLRAMCVTLARAFDDDPVSMHLFPGWRRRRGLEGFFRISLGRELLPFGHVYTTDAIEGVSAWSPPVRPEVSRSQQLIEILPLVPWALGPGLVRAMALFSLVMQHRPREQHWYLATLGTDPQHQGRGIGASLMRPPLELCDRDGVGAYLESSKEANLAYYRRFGFEVTEEFRLPGSGGPRLWGMWRQPQPVEPQR